jgi:pimeloyl-ACP methyl ester carboxylesterase
MTSETASAEAVELHHEIRGEGPPILLVPGLPGDGSQFDAVADALASDHTVITYDRRANSRSPRPAGWAITSVEEQVADAAGLLEQVSAPALVYGSSVGAIIALELARTRPELVALALLHEMPLISVLEDPAPVAAAIGEILGPAFARDGPDAALEAFLRFALGDATIAALGRDERDRMLGNGEVAMTIELPVFQAYRPEPETLTSVAARPLVGQDQALPFFHEAADWLAQALKTRVAATPGAHGPQFEHPRELAELIRALARDARADS